MLSYIVSQIIGKAPSAYLSEMNTAHDAIVDTGTRLHVYRIELKFARFFASALNESLELDQQQWKFACLC